MKRHLGTGHYINQKCEGVQGLKVKNLDFIEKSQKWKTCLDSRNCMYKATTKCLVLIETYKKDGQCPFCKIEGDKK